MKKAWLKITPFIIAGAALVLAGCGGKSAAGTSAAAKYKDVLNVAVQQQAPSLDLHKNSSLIARQMGAGTVWERLVTLNANSEPVPELCESFDMTPDAKEFVFHLRKGVKFHNGKEMKADDVVASMNRWTKGFSVARTIVGKSLFEKVDDYTVKISLEKPGLTLPDVIAGAAQPASITTIEACGNEDEKGFIKDYIGTGPYKFVKWEQDQYVLFEKFDDYVPYGDKDKPLDGWAGYKAPKIKSLYYYLVPEMTTCVAGLETGQYDVVFNVTDDYFERLKSNPEFDTLKTQGGTVAHVFNKKQGVASNLYFRQAVNAAVNCDDLLKAAYGQLYDLGSCYMDDGQPFWYSEAGKANYNLKDAEKAKALLTKAGYKGETFRLLVSPLSNMDKLALVMQQQLEAIGVKTEIILVDWATLTQYRQDPTKYDMYFTSFASVPVPSLKLYFGPTYPGWSADEKLQKLLGDFNAATTKEAAKKAWDVLQEYSWEYLPLINSGHYISAYAWNKKVEGITKFNGLYFWDVSVKE